jgi:GNAT superfamily N-acetyltransferase
VTGIDTITFRRLSGAVIAGHLDDLATLRLEIFAEYPYLYSGQRDAELTYLASYAEQAEGCAILVEEHGRVIGAATGMPLRHEGAALRDPVANTSWPVDQLYYIGELLFRPAYRARGLGQLLLSEFESQVRLLGYRKIVCVTVERSADHPQRPADAIPIDRFLARTGFVRLDGVTTSLPWLEVDGVRSDHSMQFWLKDIREEKGSPAEMIAAKAGRPLDKMKRKKGQQ